MRILVVRNEENQIAKEKAIKAYKKLFNVELVISHDENGKPICNDGHISISHTDGIYLLAVSKEALGIDIERKDRKISYRLGPIKEWTQKEAYGKFLGKGINKEIISNNVPKELMGKLMLDEDYVISICSEDKVYLVYDVL